MTVATVEPTLPTFRPRNTRRVCPGLGCCRDMPGTCEAKSLSCVCCQRSSSVPLSAVTLMGTSFSASSRLLAVTITVSRSVAPVSVAASAMTGALVTSSPTTTDSMLIRGVGMYRPPLVELVVNCCSRSATAGAARPRARRGHARSTLGCAVEGDRFSCAAKFFYLRHGVLFGEYSCVYGTVNPETHSQTPVSLLTSVGDSRSKWRDDRIRGEY